MRIKKTNVKLRLLAFILITTFVLQLTMITPVTASEEEEEDNFTTMPNYRWQNETETGSQASEQLIGDNYEVYSLNNATSGTEKFEKSRQLNSRDFYYETRFQMDAGGSQSEFFRDVIGDAIDFNEGDLEGFSASSNPTVSSEDGLMLVRRSVSDTIWGVTNSFDIETLPYDTFRIRFKANGVVTNFRLRFLYLNGTNHDHVIDSGQLSTSWNTTDIDLSAIDEWQNKLSGFALYWATSSAGSVYIDFMELIGNFDFASHVNGEVEDSWSWDDSQEYFYDVFGNVSDFEDGTVEGWTSISSGNLTVSNGWLRTIPPLFASPSFLTIGYGSLSIDSSVYDYIAIEILNSGSTRDITQIDILDSANNVVFTDSTAISPGSYHLLSGNIVSGSWTGTETDLRINVTFSFSDITNEFQINMVYLYDQELGDIENWVGLTNMYVNPEGNLVLMGQGGNPAIAVVGRTIDSDQFDLVKFRVKSDDPIDVVIRGDGDSGNVDLSSSISVTTSFTEFTVDLSIDSDWTGVFNWVGLGLGSNFLAGEHIEIDYFLIHGNWSTNDGFKFSLLNQNDEEGMYWKFTRSGGTSINEYNLDVNMLDASGIALSYDQTFNYSRSVDGWLYLKVEWHLDKKELDFKFQYENGSNIIKTRAMTDLYTTTGTGQLKLLEPGFPSLCMNNSMGPLSRSYVLIDYIDADWKIMNWIEPDEGVDTLFTASIPQSDVNNFTTVSPYGLFMDGVNTTAQPFNFAYHHYYLSTTRFDGLNFDVSGTIAGLDNGDQAWLRVSFGNVAPDGSLDLLGKVQFEISGLLATWVSSISNSTDIISLSDVFAGADSEFKASVGLYRESEDRAIITVKFNSGTNELIFSHPFEINRDLTDEFVTEIFWFADTSKVDFADDVISIIIGGFDVKRKDFIGDAVSAIISPVIDFITFILTPLFLLFQLLATIITGAANFIVDLLSPAILLVQNAVDSVAVAVGAVTTAIGQLAGQIASAVWSGIGSSLNFITTAISNIAAGIWSAFGAAAQEFVDDIVGALASIAVDIADFLLDVIEALLLILGTVVADLAGWLFDLIDALLVLLLAAAEAIWNLLAETSFFIWEALGLPDLLAIASLFLDTFSEIITGLPAFITDAIDLMFEIFIYVAIAMFAFNFLIPALTTDNFGDFAEKFVQIGKIDMTGGISLLGFKVPVPMFLIYVSMMTIYANGGLPALAPGW